MPLFTTRCDLAMLDGTTYDSSDDQFDPTGQQYSIDLHKCNYEITTTFNPQLWTIGEAFNRGLEEVVTSIVRWCKEQGCDDLFIALEYQKNMMPHLHCCASFDQPLSGGAKFDIQKGLTRICGRTTFRSVVDNAKWEDYLKKDLEVNFLKHNFIHYKYFF